MKRWWHLSVLLVILVAAMAYLRYEWHALGAPVPGDGIIEVPRRVSARGVVNLLEQNKVIVNRYAALAYILYSGSRNKLQAGEYLFDHPMTIPEVIGKLSSGSVVLHKFTIPEGLTAASIAQKWQEEGFGSAEDFSKTATAAIDIVRHFDDKATSVEGYLFPETYSFRRHTTSRQAVETMKGLPTGYNKDLQEDKEAFLKAFENVRLCLSVLRLSVGTVTLRTERLEVAASDSFMGATDLADLLVMKGVPFRNAHEIVARAVRQALEQKKQLTEIDLTAFSPHFSELPADYLAPKNIVARKRHSSVLRDA